MTAALGLGLAPMGVAPYGIGTPAITAPLGGVALMGADGTRQSVRKIDPGTRRYLYDITGRAIGDSAVRQQMYLVATTDRGSSAVLAMGNTIKSLQDITPNLLQRVRSIYTSAYSRMVARGLIKLGDITIDVTPASGNSVSKMLTRIKYTDLTTGQDQELTL